MDSMMRPQSMHNNDNVLAAAVVFKTFFFYFQNQIFGYYIDRANLSRIDWHSDLEYCTLYLWCVVCWFSSVCTCAVCDDDQQSKKKIDFVFVYQNFIANANFKYYLQIGVDCIKIQNRPNGIGWIKL